MKKKWLAVLGIIVALGVIAALLVYVFVYNKPQPDYSQEKPEFTIGAEELYSEFSNDPANSSKKYNGKVLAVTGNLDGIDQSDSLMIAIFAIQEGMFGDEGIRLTFIPEYNHQLKSLQPGSTVTIKGYCAGYNDTDVILEHCTLID